MSIAEKIEKEGMDAYEKLSDQSKKDLEVLHALRRHYRKKIASLSFENFRLLKQVEANIVFQSLYEGSECHLFGYGCLKPLYDSLTGKERDEMKEFLTNVVAHPNEYYLYDLDWKYDVGVNVYLRKIIAEYKAFFATYKPKNKDYYADRREKQEIKEFEDFFDDIEDEMQWGEINSPNPTTRR